MSYKHFSNTKCEYFPCHKFENQNCLFCYCPLYFFEDCGGDAKYIGSVKDCSSCLRNHDENSYDFVLGKLRVAFSRLGNDLSMMKLEKK